MDHDEVRELEHEFERAISDVLRRSHPHPIDPRICHLMAKAAVTVLEAASDQRPRRGGPD